MTRRETLLRCAAVVAWLCTSRIGAAGVTHKGVHLSKTDVAGELDLRFAILTFPASS